MPSIAVLLLGAVATYWDMRARIIPNRLNVAGIVAGMVLGATRGGVEGILWSAVGMAAGALAFALPWLLGGLGGGDLKLAAALGAITAWPLALPSLLLGSVAMALWSLGWALWARQRAPGGARPPLGSVRVPQALPLALGAALTLVLALLHLR